MQEKNIQIEVAYTAMIAPHYMRQWKNMTTDLAANDMR